MAKPFSNSMGAEVKAMYVSNHDFLYKSDLPHRARIVYLYLEQRANRDGICWPSQKRIAKDLGISVSTVKRAIGDLKTKKFLSSKNRYRENGSCSSNEYMILIQIQTSIVDNSSFSS